MSDPGIKAFAHLLAYLRASYLWHQSAHHSVYGPSFLSDHALYAEIYESFAAAYDTAAEKAVTACGGGIADAVAVTQDALKILEAMPRPSALAPQALAQAALQNERAFQACLSRCRQNLAGMQLLTLGLDNFLSQLADTHEMFLYKLGQRTKGGA